MATQKYSQEHSAVLLTCITVSETHFLSLTVVVMLYTGFTINLQKLQSILKARFFLLVDLQDFFSDLGSGGRKK